MREQYNNTLYWIGEYSFKTVTMLNIEQALHSLEGKSKSNILRD